jgi:hypothetical protein
MGNMRTPASILAGALVPLAMLAPLPIQTPAGKVEGRFKKSLRLAYTVVGVVSLLNQLVSIMWATVAVNQLIETNIAPAASVWALLKRDFDLEWAAVNAHFVLGMFGWCFLIGTRAFFQAGQGIVGQSVAGFAVSGLLLMISIVNRGVAAGGGYGESRCGASVFTLISHYAFKLSKRAMTVGSMAPLEITSIAVFACSIALAVRGIATQSLPKDIETQSLPKDMAP